MQAQHLNLLIDFSNGTARTEPVHVQPMPSGNYRLLHSPGFVQGIAAGDEFELLGANGEFRVLYRSGNLAVQVFATESISPLLPALAQLAGNLGGTLDGNLTKGAVLTIPVGSTFTAVEAALNAFIAQHPSCSWFYGNVYSPTDGVTPIGWWVHA
jgi:hypothetical protein